MLIQTGASGSAAAAFDTTLISNSIWLDGSGTSGDSLTRSWGTPSNEDRWIWATWYCPLREADSTGNRGNIFASGSGSNGFYLIHTSNDSTFGIFHRDSAGNEGAINTTESYRDLGRWIHLLVDYDSANSTAADRISLYVNGVKTGVNSGTRPGSGNHINVNVSGQTHRIGQDFSSTPNYHAACYLSQTLFLDNKSIAAGDYSITDFLGTPFTFGANGSQITPKSDAEITTIANAGGDQSNLLLFSNASDIDNDASSKNNDWSTSTVASANQSTNTPSLVYPVMNPLDKHSAATLSNGNLRYSSSSTTYHGVRSTFFITDSTPKIYWEATYTAGGGSTTDNIGLADFEYALGQTYGVNGTAVFATATKGSTAYFKNETATPHSNVSYDVDVGDVMRFAYDPATKKIWVGNVTNDTYLGGGNPATDSTPTATLTIEHPCSPLAGRFGSLGTTTFDFNFGQSSFTGTVPSGFVALNSANLTAPTHFGCDAFQSVTYTGNASTRSITTDISPAWVWIKNRSQADEHKLVDIVRGVQKELSSDDASNAEQTDSNGVTAFSTSSFSLGSGANGYNDSSENFIAWCWSAGTAFSNDASATSIGTLDSSGRVNASDSLSIVSYTGSGSNASIKHGLSAAPEMYWVRDRTDGNDWNVYHVDSNASPASGSLRLDNNTAFNSDATVWNGVPSSTVINLGTSDETNKLNNAFIAYCFRSVAGVCKVGSYEGNNNADGSYVPLGFKPSFFISKNIDATGSWFIIDNKRGFNSASNEAYLQAESNATETVGNVADLLSEGIKWRTTGGGNANNTFIYMAMADIAGNGTLPPIYGR
jgi:hypothetical protein